MTYGFLRKFLGARFVLNRGLTFCSVFRQTASIRDRNGLQLAVQLLVRLIENFT
jgi:hypothetical protein